MITAGIDSGSRTTKGVILDERHKIIASDIRLTGGVSKKTGRDIWRGMLEQARVSEENIACVVTTGYGRANFEFSDKKITEITCHAAGIHFLLPDVRTVLDIGGQDCKAIRVDQHGQAENFVMNDKCAAGTGRFLEVIANAMDVRLEDLGELSEQSERDIRISSICTVFAETEVISLVAGNTPVPDIVRGVHNAVTDRSVILLNKIGVIGPVAMSGGVANNAGVVRELEKRLNLELRIPENPQLAGALGAAVLAGKIAERREKADESSH